MHLASPGGRGPGRLEGEWTNPFPTGLFEKDRTKWLLKGVVKGIGDYGNSFGIPVLSGEVFFDESYEQNPLVNAFSAGIMHVDDLVSAKSSGPGNPVFIVGSSTGKDGIHGATFSSEELDPNSPVSAVQIGDPITQKKMSDVIIRELRDENLYSSITDNGAGGLSSSIGEMAKESGGFIVNLENE